MENSNFPAKIVAQGVYFKLKEGMGTRDCIVSKNALGYLGRLCDNESDFLEIYSIFKENIHSVAKRLISAGESASPLVLGAAYFIGVPAPAVR